MSLIGKTVLVTGADGFIGSHLVEALVESGANVRAMAWYNSLNHAGWLETIAPETKAKIEIIFADIRDAAMVNRAVEGCDIVFHLAALIAIPYSYDAPDSYIATNVTGTLNILQAVKQYNVKRLIHTSTSEVYGSAQSIPIHETHPLSAQSPYAASKIAADQLAQSYYCSYDLPVVTIRPFNTYGPRQSARAVIPSIIIQLAHTQTRTLKLGALHPTRDFSYVADTVQGFIAASCAPLDSVVGETINLGSQFEVSIEQTVNLIVERMNVAVTIETESTRLRPDKSEVQRLFANTEKAKSLLPWMPEYQGLSGFESGLDETIDWFSDENNLKHYNASFYHK